MNFPNRLSESFQRLTRYFLKLRITTILRDVKNIEKSLLPQEKIKEQREQAKKQALAAEGKNWWDARKHLIDIHRVCDQQVRYFHFTNRLLRRAEKLGLDSEERIEHLRDPGRLSDYARGDQLKEEDLSAAETCWRSARKELEDHIPSLFLTHAFLRVAELGRVEVAALFTGGLVFLGQVFTGGFYLAATGTGVLRYATLEDYLDEGVRGLLLVAFFWMIGEMIFWIARSEQLRSSHKWAYGPHRWVLTRPFWTALGSFIVLAVCMLGSGWAWGSAKQNMFFDERHGELELATVMGGTVLRDVFLVGTTSRTAVFLQVCEWSRVVATTRHPVSLAVVPPLLLFPERRHEIANTCRRQENTALEMAVWEEKRAWRPSRARVLVMDRALVICHAKGSACLDQESADSGTGVRERLEELQKRLDEVAQIRDVDGLQDHVDEALEEKRRELDRHLNRHRTQILHRIDGLGRELKEEIAGRGSG